MTTSTRGNVGVNESRENERDVNNQRGQYRYNNEKLRHNPRDITLRQFVQVLLSIDPGGALKNTLGFGPSV